MSSNETWQQLAAAAVNYAATRDMREAKALRDAAEADTRARWAERTGKGGESPKRGQGVVLMPFGKEKGVPINEADKRNVQWVRDRIAESIDEPGKERWRAQNVTLLEALDAELASR